jgi:ESCRT-II complex subunit VPS25
MQGPQGSGAFFDIKSVTTLWSDFPPFFTLQPNDATRATQLEEWGKLLLAHCASQRVTMLAPLAAWPLWGNPGLQRALSAEGIAAVAEHLVARRRAEWADAQRVTLRVFFRTVEEWGVLVLGAVRRKGFYDELKTLTEVTEDLGLGEEFHRLDDEIAVRVLRHLEAQGHCQISEDANMCGGAFGVLFSSARASVGDS